MAFPTTSVLDSGTAADENPLAVGWTTPIFGAPNLTDNLKRVSNKFATTAATQSDAYWDLATFGPDCEVFATLDTVTDNGINIQLSARLANLTPGNEDGYSIEQHDSNTLRYLRYDNGVQTILGADETVSLAAGDSLGLEIIGTTLQAYKKMGGTWSVACPSRTDATYSAAGNIGLGGKGLATRWTGFGGGTIVSGGPTPAQLIPACTRTGGGYWISYV